MKGLHQIQNKICKRNPLLHKAKLLVLLLLGSAAITGCSDQTRVETLRAEVTEVEDSYFEAKDQSSGELIRINAEDYPGDYDDLNPGDIVEVKYKEHGEKEASNIYVEPKSFYYVYSVERIE